MSAISLSSKGSTKSLPPSGVSKKDGLPSSLPSSGLPSLLATAQSVYGMTVPTLMSFSSGSSSAPLPGLLPSPLTATVTTPPAAPTTTPPTNNFFFDTLNAINAASNANAAAPSLSAPLTDYTAVVNSDPSPTGTGGTVAPVPSPASQTDNK